MTIAHARQTIQVVAPRTAMDESVLTSPALAFIEDLTRTFRPRIENLLQRRLTPLATHSTNCAAAVSSPSS